MTKYELEKLSDKELNKLVAKYDGYVPSDTAIGVQELFESMKSNQDPVVRMAVSGIDGGDYYGKDYCNNWSDMGQLIHKNNIALIPPDYGNDSLPQWSARSETEEPRHEPMMYTHIVKNKNPLRAAAIVYLLTHHEKCDGNHGGPKCSDPECWNDDKDGE